MAKCNVCGKRKGFGNAQVRCRGCGQLICNRQSCVKYYDQYLCPTCYLSRERKIQITLSVEKKKTRELKMAKNYEIALNYEKAAEIYERFEMWEDSEESFLSGYDSTNIVKLQTSTLSSFAPLKICRSLSKDAAGRAGGRSSRILERKDENGQKIFEQEQTRNNQIH